MKIKKQLTMLGAFALIFAITACETVSTGEISSNSSTLSVSSSESFSSEISTSNSVENDSSTSTPDVSSEIEENEYEEIVNEAYALKNGEALDGEYELGGVVTEIDIKYTPSKGICLYFDVDEPQSRSMYCYQLTGVGANLIGVGDYIWVSGSIKNYKGVIEFDKNSQLIGYELSSGDLFPDGSDDPYAGVSSKEFYDSYEVAKDADDAYYRSLHGFMSGTLETPDQAPTISSYQPKVNGKYVRNSDMLLSEDGREYTVVDAYGQEAFRVYKGGAYIDLEEVAAYIYAFGDVPVNYTASKNAKPTKSIWGEYLRVNHTAFSGDTSQYPYEPILPNISGCGGNLHYYELDIGTTGTDCDPSYKAELYNDGYEITRGAARIVYGKEDLNHNGIYEIGEFYVFYTYNHYNDFQEYLNYEGGWGEKFGNITGGGTISSKKNYNPTDYVEVVFDSLANYPLLADARIDYYYDYRKYETDAQKRDSRQNRIAFL